MSTNVSAVPKTQRAFVQIGPGGPIHLDTAHPVTQPEELAPGQCLVKLEYSGVCHSDLSIKKNHFKFPQVLKDNLIGGHEGIGRVVAVGAHTTSTKLKVGDRVGIKYIGDCCMDCEPCRKGNEGQCSNMKPTGYAIDGTFQEYAVAAIAHAIPIPDSISSEAAAPIMCAGLSVYSALRKSGTHIGDWVVIPGAGGGLGHLAVQYARAMGLQVLALDTGAAKKEMCASLGADAWVDFADPATPDVVSEIVRITGGGAHAAIVATGTGAAYKQAAFYLRTGGSLMVVGLPPTALFDIPIGLVAAKAMTIQGVFTGDRQTAVEAVEIAASGKVKCNYVVRGLSELEAIYDELEKGQVAGRIVLDISK